MHTSTLWKRAGEKRRRAKGIKGVASLDRKRPGNTLREAEQGTIEYQIPLRTSVLLGSSKRKQEGIYSDKGNINLNPSV